MGIDLELDKIEKNPGLKAVAKLCLNSLWGKFGQRQNKTQVTVIYSVKELWDLLLNDQLTDFHISVIDENRLMVAYRMKDVCIPNSHNTNIAMHLCPTATKQATQTNNLYHPWHRFIESCGRISVPPSYLERINFTEMIFLLQQTLPACQKQNSKNRLG